MESNFVTIVILPSPTGSSFRLRHNDQRDMKLDDFVNEAYGTWVLVKDNRKWLALIAAVALAITSYPSCSS